MYWKLAFWLEEGGEYMDMEGCIMEYHDTLCNNPSSTQTQRHIAEATFPCRFGLGVAVLAFGGVAAEDTNWARTFSFFWVVLTLVEKAKCWELQSLFGHIFFLWDGAWCFG
jgi:hypothetical protein